MGNSYNKYNVSNGNMSFNDQHQNDEHYSWFKRVQSRSSSVSHSVSPYPDFLVKLSEVMESKTQIEEGCDGIGRKTFQKYIVKASKTASNRLFDYFVHEDKLEDKESMIEGDSISISLSKNAFNHQAMAVINCVTDSQQLEYYVKIFSNGKEEIAYNDVYELILSCFEVFEFGRRENPKERSSSLPADDILSSVSKAVMHGKDHTTTKYIFNWLSQHCPKMVSLLHRYISHTLTVGYAAIPDNRIIEDVLFSDQVTPIVEGASTTSAALRYPSLIWLLSCSLPQAYASNTKSGAHEPDLLLIKEPKKFINRLLLADQPTSWLVLFNSDEHGLSINRFQHHVFDYHGPNFMVITTEDGTMFGVASDQEWRDSKHFFGGKDTMCFKLYPEYKIIEKGSNILYFNLSSRGFPTGLQVGSDSTNRALEIDSNLHYVHYRQIPYKLKSLEVWACGSETARERQIEYKKLTSSDVEKRRKVVINHEWKDHPDRYLLELAGNQPSYGRFEKDTQNQSSHK